MFNNSLKKGKERTLKVTKEENKQQKEKQPFYPIFHVYVSILDSSRAAMHKLSLQTKYLAVCLRPSAKTMVLNLLGDEKRAKKFRKESENVAMMIWTEC